MLEALKPIHPIIKRLVESYKDIELQKVEDINTQLSKIKTQ